MDRMTLTELRIKKSWKADKKLAFTLNTVFFFEIVGHICMQEPNL